MTEIKWILITLSFFIAQANAQDFQLCGELGQGGTVPYQGLNGWLYREIDLKDKYYTAPTLKWLEELQKALATQGIRLAIVAIPTRASLDPNSLTTSEVVATNYDQTAARAAYTQAISDLQQLSIIAPDLSQIPSELTPNFFLRRNNHWTSEGARVSASIVAQAIQVQSVEVYEQLPKTDFASKNLGVQEVTGAFNKIVQDVCGITLDSQETKLEVLLCTMP